MHQRNQRDGKEREHRRQLRQGRVRGNVAHQAHHIETDRDAVERTGDEHRPDRRKGENEREFCAAHDERKPEQARGAEIVDEAVRHKHARQFHDRAQHARNADDRRGRAELLQIDIAKLLLPIVHDAAHDDCARQPEERGTVE